MSNTSEKQQWFQFHNDLLSQAKRSRELCHADQLENPRKQAKELLAHFQGGQPQAVERFKANHPSFPKEEICLADAQAVIAREHGFPSWPKMKSALGVCTLADEAQRIRQKLQADGKVEFVGLFTEDSLKSAIIKGVQSYESLPDEVHGPHPAGMDYFTNVIKPLLLDILENGSWPDSGAVDVYYQQTDDRGVSYDGLGAELDFVVQDDRYPRYPGLCLSILDLWYGRF